uniref:Uncharacterized protein n=1 Tax=Glossina palpalis gambiensis TaxID=67801 RepID=A0A1B0AV31_9MUSC
MFLLNLPLMIFAFVMLLADRWIGIAASASIPYAAYLIYNLFFIDESVAGSTKGLHELVFFQKNAQQSPAPAQVNLKSLILNTIRLFALSSYKPILAIGANNVWIEERVNNHFDLKIREGDHVKI